MNTKKAESKGFNDILEGKGFKVSEWGRYLMSCRTMTERQVWGGKENF
jgi:hypothetical protein